MLWVTGWVWPYVWQRSEAVEHAVLRQLLFKESMFRGSMEALFSDTLSSYCIQGAAALSLSQHKLMAVVKKKNL